MAEPRVPFMRDLTWRLEALGYDLGTALVRLFPTDWVSDFGGWLMRKLGPMSGAARIARRNLEIAFPDLPSAELDRLMEAQWDNLGRTFFEFPISDRLTPASGRVEVVNVERLEAIKASGKPVIFVSGHFSNWEIMPAVIVQAGVPCRITYRAANNPYIDRRIRETRARYGVTLFAPKGGAGSRDILTALKEGYSVALMNDQKFNEGVAAPFFGRTVLTAGGPTRMALKSDTVLQTMWLHRTKGARFRVYVDPPIELERTGSRDADVEAGVRKINAYVEARIRDCPAEWFWVHKRWPNEEYRRE